MVKKPSFQSSTSMFKVKVQRQEHQRSRINGQTSGSRLWFKKDRGQGSRSMFIVKKAGGEGSRIRSKLKVKAQGVKGRQELKVEVQGRCSRSKKPEVKVQGRGLW